MCNLYMVFSNPKEAVAVRIGLFPGWPTRIVLPLSVCSGKELFLKRAPGCFKTQVMGANLPVDRIELIEFGVPKDAQGWIEVKNARVVSEPPAEFTFPDEPLVDELHQWRSRDWPGKARTLDEVRIVLEQELSAPLPLSSDYCSRFGGFLARRFSSTGFFRVEKKGETWWLVDPEGYAFWSAGMDCVRATVTVPSQGIERVFAERPPISDNDQAAFDALSYNLRRALGEDWYPRWKELTRRRLIRLGFNTVGNWSDPQFARACGIPRVHTMQGFPRSTRALFRDFPDVWHAEFTGAAERFAEQLNVIADDPLVLGYFMDNEPQWAFINNFDLGKQLLISTGRSAARDELIRQLEAKYQTITALNRAWNASFSSFEALQEPISFPDQATEDTLEFTRSSVERLIRIPAQACRKFAPNHLNLGLRWAWIHSDYQLAGADALDVFSVNRYALRPEPELFDSLSKKTGKPLIIGEFHCGSVNRGLPSGGIYATETMEESVEAFRYYMENAAAHPAIVGAHYFQWNDQHVMGRSDGENMQIGLCDITGRLYPEWERGAPDVMRGLLDMRDGARAPSFHRPKTTNVGSLVW